MCPRRTVRSRRGEGDRHDSGGGGRSPDAGRCCEGGRDYEGFHPESLSLVPSIRTKRSWKAFPSNNRAGGFHHLGGPSLGLWRPRIEGAGTTLGWPSRRPAKTSGRVG